MEQQIGQVDSLRSLWIILWLESLAETTVLIFFSSSDFNIVNSSAHVYLIERLILVYSFGTS